MSYYNDSYNSAAGASAEDPASLYGPGANGGDFAHEVPYAVGPAEDLTRYAAPHDAMLGGGQSGYYGIVDQGIDGSGGGSGGGDPYGGGGGSSGGGGAWGYSVSRWTPIEEQMILRVPERIAVKIRKTMFNDNEENPDQIDGPQGVKIYINCTDPNQRRFKVVVAGSEEEQFDAVLVDLPCIVETQKTFDNETYYKSGNVSQMLKVYDSKESPEDDKELKDLGIFKYDSGVTPPTWGIRSMYFKPNIVCNCEQLQSDTPSTTASDKKRCDDCGGIPKRNIKWAEREILNLMNTGFSEIYESTDEEYEEEVTDDEWEDDQATPNPINTPMSPYTPLGPGNISVSGPGTIPSGPSRNIPPPTPSHLSTAPNAQSYAQGHGIPPLSQKPVLSQSLSSTRSSSSSSASSSSFSAASTIGSSAGGSTASLPPKPKLVKVVQPKQRPKLVKVPKRAKGLSKGKKS